MKAIPHWHDLGACRDTGPALFFGPDNETQPAKVRREWKAKRVCGSCLVRSNCLAYAMDADERHGVWGGLSEGDRERDRRNARRRAAARRAA